jgi:RNA polymerase sigma-32 factor
MAYAYLDDPATRQANLRYIRKAMHAPLLEREDELALAWRWKDKRDEKALHALVNAHARLVVAIAAKFRNYGLPTGDLIQEGSLGLMEAAARFDPSRENRFSTYATWWIKAQIQDFVLRNWSIVRTGTTAAQKSLFFNLRRLRAKIAGQSARDYLDEESAGEIARELDVSYKEVRDMEARLHGSDSSLNSPIGDEGDDEWQDMLADRTPSPEDLIMAKKDDATRARWIRVAMDKLSPREKIIIRKRQLGDKSATLEDVGRHLGISKERVRQLEQRATEKLRASLAGAAREAGLDRTDFFR